MSLHHLCFRLMSRASNLKLRHLDLDLLGRFVLQNHSHSQNVRALSLLSKQVCQNAQLSSMGFCHPMIRPGTVCLGQRRAFWGLDVAFNKVDEERVRLAGPDRAAAEWVLRNGGSIKWTTSAKSLNDYNLLPSTNFEMYKVEEIDLTATNVIGLGFEHLKDLHHVRKIKLHGCRTIMDDALEHLQMVKDTLEHLEISRCPMITEKGLNQLLELKKLKYLVLYDLIETRNFQTAVDRLQKSMPWCKFETTDPQLSEPS